MSDDDYKVGYGRPPKHSQFPPGVSGNKGRRKKPSQSQKEILGRVRDEIVIIDGKKMTKFEVAVRSVFHTPLRAAR